MSLDCCGQGLLVAVVGPSGAGKDTLIRLAMERLRGEPRFILARRVITRPPDGSTEDHDSLDEAAFERAEADGAFCLTWRAHGLAYGLPHDVVDAVAAGHVVLANLSRSSLDEAAIRFPRLAVIEITAPRSVLVARIAARGRETPAEIEARLARHVDLHVPPGALNLSWIDNSGTPDVGAGMLVQHLSTCAQIVHWGAETPTRAGHIRLPGQLLYEGAQEQTVTFPPRPVSSS